MQFDGRILDDARSADDPDVYADMDADSAKNSVLHRAARYDHLEVVKVRSLRTDQQRSKIKMLFLSLSQISGSAGPRRRPEQEKQVRDDAAAPRVRGRRRGGLPRPGPRRRPRRPRRRRRTHPAPLGGRTRLRGGRGGAAGGGRGEAGEGGRENENEQNYKKIPGFFFLIIQHFFFRLPTRKVGLRSTDAVRRSRQKKRVSHAKF